MARTIELLLRQTVENLGIVGDTVKVRPGYARNYLLPMGLAVPPTPTRIDALKDARARAHAELLALRNEREELLKLMHEVQIELVRACNDQGVLYGSVSQRDVADALKEAGYNVDVRSVRLPSSIRRVGPYEVPIQFEKDLRTEITIVVMPDHALEDLEAEETQSEAGAEGQAAPDAGAEVPTVRVEKSTAPAPQA